MSGIHINTFYIYYILYLNISEDGDLIAKNTGGYKLMYGFQFLVCASAGIGLYEWLKYRVFKNIVCRTTQ